MCNDERQGKIINGTVGEFKKFLANNFSDDMEIMVDGSIDIVTDPYEEFGYNIRGTYYDESYRCDNKYYNKPSKENNTYICEEECFSIARECQDYANGSEKATVGELIEELNKYPLNCKFDLDYNGIIIENTDGALDGIFNEPCKRAKLVYSPEYCGYGSWGFTFRRMD